MNTSIRKVDVFNRIKIPLEVQKQFGFKSGDTLCLTLEDKRILVTPKIPCCPICKAALDNEKYGVCRQCAALVAN